MVDIVEILLLCLIVVLIYRKKNSTNLIHIKKKYGNDIFILENGVSLSNTNYNGKFYTTTHGNYDPIKNSHNEIIGFILFK